MGVSRQRLVLRVVRGFLLLLLALGVGGMHTLGHLDGEHGDVSTGMQGNGAAPVTLVSPPVGLHALAFDAGMPGFDPTSVCLAILTSLLLVVLRAAWIQLRRRATHLGSSLSPVRQVARPPPERTSLRLIRLSVLRI